jgi:predicted Zn-dependent protease with MMP-like domain
VWPFTEDPEDLEDIIDRIEDLYDAEDLEGVKRELRRGRKSFPDDLDLREWEAIIAADEERFEEALALLEVIVRVDPERFTAVIERARVLHELGRFKEALQRFEALERNPMLDDEPGDRAWLHHMKGSCLDRLGRNDEADAEFRKAAALDPEEYPRPPRLSLKAFEKVVEEALDSIPEKLDAYVRQIAVAIRDYPTAEDPDPFLLGLYEGVPRTERSHELRDHLDQIFIYKRNLEIEFPDIDELRDEIRKTVIHEVGHHFGLGEEDMGEYA